MDAPDRTSPARQSGVARRRRVARRVVPVALALAATALGPVSVAHAAPASCRTDPDQVGCPVDNRKWDSQMPDAFCGFSVKGNIVADEEQITAVRRSPNGTLSEDVAGKFVVAFTNLKGRSVTIDASGPYTTTHFPDGSRTLHGEGAQISGLGPRSQTHLFGVDHGMGLIYTTGITVAATDPTNLTTRFSASGDFVNVCLSLTP